MKFFQEYTKTLEKYSDLDKELIRHGLNIILLDGSEIMTVLLVSLVFHVFPESLVYVFLFSYLRICCGGYHCMSSQNCFLLYLVMYLLFLLSLKLELHGYMFVLSNSALFLLAKAPVQHVLNPLTKEEYLLNRRKAVLRIILSFLLYVMIPRFRLSVMFAVFYNTTCGIALMMSDNYRRNKYAD